jgi:hypothetical protein
MCILYVQSGLFKKFSLYLAPFIAGFGLTLRCHFDVSGNRYNVVLCVQFPDHMIFRFMARRQGL